VDSSIRDTLSEREICHPHFIVVCEVLFRVVVAGKGLVRPSSMGNASPVSKGSRRGGVKATSRISLIEALEAKNRLLAERLTICANLDENWRYRKVLGPVNHVWFCQRPFQTSQLIQA
jgi:hypothetical protein